MPQEMHIKPERARQLLENLKYVADQVAAANKSQRQIRLIAVSKLHPASTILALHNPASLDPSSLPASVPPAHFHFGENYLQELQQKADILPKTIRWHFIGGLQSNKARPLAESVESLWCVSSVDSAKKADGLEKGRRALVERLASEKDEKSGEEDKEKTDLDKLRVHVQVNTSGEAAKSGVEPADTAALCRHIRDNCPHLQLLGLMTIGAIARSQSAKDGEENADFVCLRETRDRVAQELGVPEGELELSMGMSADFEEAIRQGSGEVRVGSTIFGQRPPKGEAKVLDDVEEGKD
ncbi:hypothetical protein EJ05DRAFT_255632 [Pseudovirgaria hyperparasitica]|uniref:Pyridoxal phosphate homeostasis protein n=1 Tax=Pseudovirgaria hyperparasitica TaxID=470096 RepID=A0A6A6WEN9_9PEZI|nr:uncharacterized protein EJ05DRAFT_255632 [Pseudovirgaria hyperparasitica]KAF2761183.1 hypothetical protein EJ05DRAFT_255632 [Pseudovirgaria hyperparasitica]